MKLADVLKSADWKTEKHVPVIEAPDCVKAGEKAVVTVSVGKEIAHPNTTEHHIRWIRLYFKPDSGNFVYDLGYFEFNAHGESTEGANKGPVYTEPAGQVTAKLQSSGTLLAVSYCNIHGIWESSKPITVE
ncbi:class II SORL domain-containing protein [Acetonema longum]|uniref:Putative superoxide reductase n=1 Tax=Acetonema longum DSM 6540 TaxID=1009370 RepID=F7NDH0_9FIRM|nr:class II SORL domain-containing protein [Acetonema longum]EGO65923.1 Putative superoxide reductase [Acetonema longum DSM 6540]